MPILVNGSPIERFNFPGGECSVRVKPNQLREDKIVQITAVLYSSNDIMDLLLTVNAIRYLEYKSKIHLYIPYFPYARQDRVCNPGEALSLQVMANLINGLNCDEVVICDPHSRETKELVACNILSQAELIGSTPLRCIIALNKLTVVCPDEGAVLKIHTLNRYLPDETEYVYCTKIRDTATGEILGVNVPNDVKDKSLIIIDDICDGGRTFIEIAKKLQEYGAKEIFLYVTHGIFSKGLDVLRPYFTHVYCYHTFLTDYDTTYLTVEETYAY